MSLQIQYSDNKLHCQMDGTDHLRKAYLEKYIARLNQYKVIGWHQGSPVFSLYQPAPATHVGARSLQHRLLRRFNQVRLPATATISVNKNCQCDCDHCSAHFYNHALNPDLTDNELRRALVETVSLGVTTVILLGGEPLLRKNLPELIAGVPEDQANVVLFTNGEFLTRAMCAALKQAGVYGVFVSLDATDASTHDLFRRRKGLFNKAMQGIENLVRAGIMVGVSSCLSHDRLKENFFEKMLEFGKNHGVNEMTFFDAIPTGKWLRDDTVYLTTKDREKIRSLVKSYRMRPDYPGLSVQSTLTSECGSAFCFAANTQFYLSAAGEMCPCDFTPLTIGKFPEQHIAELWHQMIHAEPYVHRAKSCRMQDPGFRKKYLQTIPIEGPYPYPLCTTSLHR